MTRNSTQSNPFSLLFALSLAAFNIVLSCYFLFFYSHYLINFKLIKILNIINFLCSSFLYKGRNYFSSYFLSLRLAFFWFFSNFSSLSGCLITLSAPVKRSTQVRSLISAFWFLLHRFFGVDYWVSFFLGGVVDCDDGGLKFEFFWQWLVGFFRFWNYLREFACWVVGFCLHDWLGSGVVLVDALVGI